MRGAVGASRAVAVAALLVLAGCTGESTTPPAGSSSATASVSPTAAATGAPATQSATAEPSAGQATPIGETPSGAAPGAAAASPSATPTGPAAPAGPTGAPTVATPVPPPARPDQPHPGPAADEAATFQECSQEYLARTQTISLSPTVTPIVVEAWAERYQKASALAAEGSYSAAAAACRELLAAMEVATR